MKSFRAVNRSPSPRTVRRLAAFCGVSFVVVFAFAWLVTAGS